MNQAMSWVMTDGQFHIAIGFIVLLYIINFFLVSAHNKNRHKWHK